MDAIGISKLTILAELREGKVFQVDLTDLQMKMIRNDLPSYFKDCNIRLLDKPISNIEPQANETKTSNDREEICLCTGNPLKYDWCIRCNLFVKCRLSIKKATE